MTLAELAAELRRALLAGEDPLGEAFLALRPAGERRELGATYTPPSIVDAMVGWAAERARQAGGPRVVRVVDPGCGSGRFLLAAARAFPQARLVGVEIDPVAAELARASLALVGAGERTEILDGDYRELSLPDVAGRTLFLGNPPYVRHHGIEPRWKRWLARTAARRGLRASGLAGLHAHFFLATAERARPGDLGCFVTAAEWLDVGYGRLVRDLLAGELGGVGVTVIDPRALPFADAATTAAIACFLPGERSATMRLARVPDAAALGALDAGRWIPRERLAGAARWSPFLAERQVRPAGLVELGELFRVHRGTATGANSVWIADEDVDLPRSLLFPCVTRARELFVAGGELSDLGALRRAIDLPVDLSALEPADRARVERFLARARAARAHESYLARSRRAWWSIGLRAPAPVLATYMARRPPAFVLNPAGAHYLNIAHGLYPRQALPDATVRRIATWLSAEVSLADGRAYAGGLVKFEPREMERLLVPDPSRVAVDAYGPLVADRRSVCPPSSRILPTPIANQ